VWLHLLAAAAPSNTHTHTHTHTHTQMGGQATARPLRSAPAACDPVGHATAAACNQSDRIGCGAAFGFEGHGGQGFFGLQAQICWLDLSCKEACCHQTPAVCLLLCLCSCVWAGRCSSCQQRWLSPHECLCVSAAATLLCLLDPPHAAQCAWHSSSRIGFETSGF
jgi:hypothetical protein